MFVENLVGPEKSAFLGLARKVVQADGVLSPREAQLLSSFAAATGAEIADGTVQELAAEFQTRQSKVSALLELIGLGYADGEYRLIERTSIDEISRALGFDDNEVAAMESWVIRQTALLQEAAAFWTGEDA